MKTLFILNSDFGVEGTVGSRILPLAKELLKNKELIILCRNFKEELTNKYNIKKVVPFGSIIMKILYGITIFSFQKFKSNKIKNKIFEFFLIRKLKKIDLSQIDMIHSWDFLPRTYEILKNKNPKIKIIQDVAMAFLNIIKNIKDKEKLFKYDRLESPNYLKDAFRYIDIFVAPSEFVKKSLINEGIEENKIVIVPFGVDINKFKPINKDLNGKFKVAFSGNVNNRKGIPYLIEAWKELNLENAELNIYGRIYPEVRKYLKNTKKYNINLYGFIDLTQELPKNHVYVFPSLLEGSAKSIYEALACGLPVITTFNSGSIIRDDEEGFIVPIQNTGALKEKILFFYNNRNKIKEFGERARRLAEEYTWKRYGKEVNKLYRLVLK